MAANLMQSAFISLTLIMLVSAPCRDASASRVGCEQSSAAAASECDVQSVLESPIADGYSEQNLSVEYKINSVSEFRTMSGENLRQFTCGEPAAIGERMFRCELCESVVPAGTRSSKVVLVTRDKTYDERGGGGFASRGGFRKRGPSRGSSPKKDYDKGGEGQEIVREVSVCPKCAAEHKQKLDLESSNTNEGAE